MPVPRPARSGDATLQAVSPKSTPKVPADTAATVVVGRAHRRRLRMLWRSAGWPSHDPVDLDLVAGGLVERIVDAQARETLRLTDAGVRCLAASRLARRASYDAHEDLVARVVLELQRAGRIAWRGLALRAPLDAAQAEPATESGGSVRWAVACPDVYSIRHTTVEAYAEPAVHEIKVRRSDLLADLRQPDKGAAYRALGARCWYVLREGIGTADDVPEAFGVLQACGSSGTLEVLRPAPARPCRVSFAVWMALARATPEPPPDEPEQWPLREPGPTPPPGEASPAGDPAPGD
jgi:hypothetical protein